MFTYQVLKVQFGHFYLDGTSFQRIHFFSLRFFTTFPSMNNTFFITISTNPEEPPTKRWHEDAAFDAQERSVSLTDPSWMGFNFKGC